MAHVIEFSLPNSRHRDADDERALKREIAKRQGLHPDAIAMVRLARRSLDARKHRFSWSLKVEYWLRGEELPPPAKWQPPKLPPPERDAPRVAVIGSGPAGLFAALELAARGVPVTILERGKDVQARRHDLARITRGLAIDPDSNYCFGEGGAGTYSDGKLYTRTGTREEVAAVLRTFVEHGAPERILIDGRPHIGSNRLPEVVAAIRATLVGAGVDYRFGARVTDLLRDSSGALCGLRIGAGAECEDLSVRTAILATGHGARDIIAMLDRQRVAMSAKPFAIGVRMEHPQSVIDRMQYGCAPRPDGLPPAAYEMAARQGERGVYSFCMCPGGWIVPAMTEAGGIVLNGMSLSRRDSPFANSGMVVGIEPADLVGAGGRAWGLPALGLEPPPVLAQSSALLGIEVQRRIEENAWIAGGGQHRAPAQRLIDFIKGNPSAELPDSSYQPGLAPARIEDFLPPGLHTRLREGLIELTQRMPALLDEAAVLAGVESRTSSPVRIERDPQTLESPTCAGLHPAGEGAGFAGGIVSAALDGIRVARAILRARRLID